MMALYANGYYRSIKKEETAFSQLSRGTRLATRLNSA
jgi:hypothetical protein